jgi:hypothetical protein
MTNKNIQQHDYGWVCSKLRDGWIMRKTRKLLENPIKIDVSQWTIDQKIVVDVMYHDQVTLVGLQGPISYIGRRAK